MQERLKKSRSVRIDYEPSSLRGFSANVNRFLKERKYPVSIIDGDKEFDQARKCLEAGRKQLKE